MYKIYNEDGTVETLIEKEKLDNVLSKYMNTNIDKDKLKDDEIFLTSNENLFIKKYDINELLYIWYTAKTELYDRILSTEKDKYDITCTIVRGNRYYSSLYAQTLRIFIVKCFPEFEKPNYFKNYTMQRIIDLYYYLLSNDKNMQFIENLFIEYELNKI